MTCRFAAGKKWLQSIKFLWANKKLRWNATECNIFFLLFTYLETKTRSFHRGRGKCLPKNEGLKMDSFESIQRSITWNCNFSIDYERLTHCWSYTNIRNTCLIDLKSKYCHKVLSLFQQQGQILVNVWSWFQVIISILLQIIHKKRKKRGKSRFSALANKATYEKVPRTNWLWQSAVCDQTISAEKIFGTPLERQRSYHSFGTQFFWNP